MYFKLSNEYLCYKIWQMKTSLGINFRNRETNLVLDFMEF